MEELRGIGRIKKGEQIPKQPELFRMGGSALDSDVVLAGPLIPIEDLQALLLPTTKELTGKQQRDLEHLQQHIRTGSALFVTLDADDFIKHGRREALYRIGVWTFTPAEVVEHLRRWHPGLRKDAI
jgi:hypothetical protein